MNDAQRISGTHNNGLTGYSPRLRLQNNVELLRRLRKPPALTQKPLVSDILRAYLGGYSVERVHVEQIHRGEGEVLDAVILFCDLRGTSALAEHYDLKGPLGV